MSYSRRTVLKMLATLCVSVRSLSVLAQSYPSRPIKVIAPWPPGSSVDLSARTVSSKLSDILKTNFIIENRGGADGYLAEKPRPGRFITATSCGRRRA